MPRAVTTSFLVRLTCVSEVMRQMPPNEPKLNRAGHLKQELKRALVRNRERHSALAPARCNVMSVARDVPWVPLAGGRQGGQTWAAAGCVSLRLLRRVVLSAQSLKTSFSLDLIACWRSQVTEPRLEWSFLLRNS